MRSMGLRPERKIITLRRRAKHGRHASWSGAVARPVQLGGELPDGRVEVVGGLEPGDQVILSR